MSQSDSRSFGQKPQHLAGNPLPFSPDVSDDPGRPGETLSDVVSEPTDRPEALSVASFAAAREAVTPARSEARTDDQPPCDSSRKCQHSGEVFQPTPDTCNTGVSIRHFLSLIHI